MLEVRKPTKEELKNLENVDWLVTFESSRSRVGVVVFDKLPVEETDSSDPFGMPIQVERKVLTAVLGHDPIVSYSYVWRGGKFESCDDCD